MHGALEEQLLPHGRLEAPPRSALLSDRLGVALVYGAALAGWCYLVVWGALAEAGVGHAQTVGVVLAGLAGLALVVEVERLEGAATETPAVTASNR